ncbi:MAG: nucleotidyltransferase domain-containing protein, partial [Euryarchaeota archaeon]|nr:nucleotidyltransferase domain-containing protein [Euryarchaeota archaeon]
MEKKYGSQLKSILLFGSYARGEETEDSDIDIAVILEDFDHACTEIERTGNYSGMLIGLPIAILYFLTRKITAEGAEE